MEDKKNTLWEKGIVIALILIVLDLIFHFTGLNENSKIVWVGFGFFVIALIYVTMLYSKQHSGQVTFGNLFAHGFKISAIVTLIMLLWMILSFKVIFPDTQEKLMQAIRAAALKKGASEADFNKGMEFTKKYFMTFMIGGTILYYAFFGLIGSLLGAAFSKKIPANSSPFQQ